MLEINRSHEPIFIVISISSCSFNIPSNRVLFSQKFLLPSLPSRSLSPFATVPSLPHTPAYLFTIYYLNYLLTSEMQRQQDSFDGSFPDNIRSPNYKAQWSSKKNKLVINVSDTQYAVVKHVAKKNKWFLQTDPFTNLNFDICWTDNHVKPDLFARMQPHQKINHFPGMTILSRKNNLGTALMNFRKQFPGEYEFFPITWSLPNDYADLQAYHECRQQGKAQTFIVKPEASCQGRGIYLTRNIEKIKYDRCVVQRYMHKPYLIDGLKFDMRIYVLVAGIDPLRIFVYEEGLARFATEEYRPPRSENLDNKFMHLTNYAINKQNPNFIFNESVTNMDVGHKRSLTSVYRRIAEQGHDVDELKQKIYDIFIKTIITGYPTLSNSVSNVHPDNFANDMCYQILGFDIMIDHKLNPYLLEINYTPSFTADTPLDRYIKKSLIADTFTLLNVNQKWKKEMKIKRDKEIQDRMMSGKRKKYTPEERQALIIEEARKRDEYEKSHLGRFTKIFIINEDQLAEYKKYYDFSMELYNSSPKDNASFVPPKGKEAPYNFYYEPKRHNRRDEKENLMKNNSRLMRDSKENEGFTSKSGQTQVSFMSASVNKRASSAKGKKEKKKVVYDKVSSKKSLKNEEYGKNNQQLDSIDGFVVENASIFTNKNLQQLILKQRQSEHPLDHEDSDSHDFS